MVGTRPDPRRVPKVNGAARYAADFHLPGALYGKVLRSPHAHALIKSIDTSKAAALPGVKAVMTGADLPDHDFQYIGPDRMQVNFWHISRNIMAREKAYYEGRRCCCRRHQRRHRAQGLALIEVEYEPLPHVIDVDDAMAEDAPLLFDDMITRGVEPPPSKPSNIAKQVGFRWRHRSRFRKRRHYCREKYKTAESIKVISATGVSGTLDRRQR